jgi:RNA polymerase sigma-70 factor (ECF subfamily)
MIGITELSHGASRARPTATEAASIFEEHEARIRRYVGYRVRDPGEVEDLTAEVFRRFVAGPVPSESTAWMPWLLRVAHNAVVDHYRRRRRFDPLSLLVDRPDDAPDLIDHVIHDERLRVVDGALAGLPGRQRAAIYLRFYEDLGYADVAAILGMPVATARSLVHRGLRRVVAQLGREDAR